MRLGFLLPLLVLAACTEPSEQNAVAPGEPLEINVAMPGPMPDNASEVGQVAKQCSMPVYCGEIGFIDCGSAADGPAYYFQKGSGKILGTCGGACMIDSEQCRKSCPPPKWTCRHSAAEPAG